MKERSKSGGKVRSVKGSKLRSKSDGSNSGFMCIDDLILSLPDKRKSSGSGNGGKKKVVKRVVNTELVPFTVVTPRAEDRKNGLWSESFAPKTFVLYLLCIHFRAKLHWVLQKRGI